MNSSLTKAINIYEIAELSLMCALMFVLKETMNVLPNIHPVALLIMLCTMVYGWKALYPVFGFIILEYAVFGFGPWSLMYLYIWPLLVVISMLIRNQRNRFVWGTAAGIFGLCFGALCSIPYLITSGIEGAMSFWIAGIPFDLIHGVSNFCIVTLLLPRLYNLTIKICFKS